MFFFFPVTSEGTPGANSPSVGLGSPSVRSSSLASPAIMRTTTDSALQSIPSSSKLNGVFGFDDNEEDGVYKRKKMRHFEITEEVSGKLI